MRRTNKNRKQRQRSRRPAATGGRLELVDQQCNFSFAIGPHTYRLKFGRRNYNADEVDEETYRSNLRGGSRDFYIRVSNQTPAAAFESFADGVARACGDHGIDVRSDRFETRRDASSTLLLTFLSIVESIGGRKGFERRLLKARRLLGIKKYDGAWMD